MSAGSLPSWLYVLLQQKGVQELCDCQYFGLLCTGREVRKGTRAAECRCKVSYAVHGLSCMLSLKARSRGLV